MVCLAEAGLVGWRTGFDFREAHRGEEDHGLEKKAQNHTGTDEGSPQGRDRAGGGGAQSGHRRLTPGGIFTLFFIRFSRK